MHGYSIQKESKNKMGCGDEGNVGMRRGKGIHHFFCSGSELKGKVEGVVELERKRAKNGAKNGVKNGTKKYVMNVAWGSRCHKGE